ncbi:MAG: protein phosphatase 2C domain-containing protein [Myxococcota bacterium]
MNPIRDITDVKSGAVLYHSAFGFAKVEGLDSQWVHLDWEGQADSLPSRVGHEVVLRVYALCPEDGFFHRALHEPDALQRLLQENPGEGLALMLADLHGPQREQDLKEWIVGRGLMNPGAFQHWWESVRPSLVEDTRFFSGADGVALRPADAVDGPRIRLENPLLTPGRRLDLALASREELDDDFFFQQVLLAWRTGGTQVRDLALAALRERDPDDIVEGLLEAGTPAIEALIHGLRHGGWDPRGLRSELHSGMLALVLDGLERGGTLDEEGRLAATLARWRPRSADDEPAFDDPLSEPTGIHERIDLAELESALREDVDDTSEIEDADDEAAADVPSGDLPSGEASLDDRPDPSEHVVKVLSSQASHTDGRRLLRATFAALPPRRAQALALDLLETSLQGPDPQASQWMGGEILAFGLVDENDMASRLDEERPQIAQWFREEYVGVQTVKEGPPEYEDPTDEAPSTAEIELSDVLKQPIPLAKLPPRSGASLLGLGLAMGRALAAHHKDSRVVNPTANSVMVLPDESMTIEPGPAEAPGCPRPATEPPSLASDVFAASVLLLEALLGRRWPATVHPSRAVPYLRSAVPMLPLSSLAALDAGLHPDPTQRPQDGLDWLARWQTSAVTEESRGYAARNATARLSIGYDTHVGRMKILMTQTNQDCLFIGSRGPVSLLVVCDGISTANAGSGDVASSIACHVIANLWEQRLSRLESAGPAELKEFLDQALQMANTAVCEAALRFAGGNLDGRVPMGTTCTVAVVHGNWVSLAWLGDSRAYLVGPYGASLVTADENQAGERLRAWHLSFLEEWDPAGFALVGYLGHFDELVRPEALSAHHVAFTMLPGERLLICSDGVTDYVSETHPEVSSILAKIVMDLDPEEACRQLVALANRGGGGDNATSLIAQLWG